MKTKIRRRPKIPLANHNIAFSICLTAESHTSCLHIMLRRVGIGAASVCAIAITAAAVSHQPVAAASSRVSDHELVQQVAVPLTAGAHRRLGELLSWGALTRALRPRTLCASPALATAATGADAAAELPLSSLPADIVAAEVAFGERYAALIDKRGRLHVVLPSAASSGTPTAPTCIELPAFRTLRPVQLACSDQAFFVVTSGGYLYEVRVPAERLPAPPAPALAITASAAGAALEAIESDSDNLAKSDNRAAHPNSASFAPSISAADFGVSQVKDLGYWQRPIKVAAGRAHAVVLTASGHVFTRGMNDAGQLGQESPLGPAIDSDAATARFAPVFSAARDSADSAVSTEQLRLHMQERTQLELQRQREAAAARAAAEHAKRAAQAAAAGTPLFEFAGDAVGFVSERIGAAIGGPERFDPQTLTRALQDTMGTPKEQLELTDDEQVAHAMPPPSDDPCVDIAAGAEHTVLVTRSGRVFTCGADEHMQCAQGRTWVTGLARGRMFPTLVEPLRDIHAIAAAAGEAHTAVLVRVDDDSAKGDGSGSGNGNGSAGLPRTAVVSWGRGAQGQLGHASSSIHLAPPRVVDALNGLRHWCDRRAAAVPLNTVRIAAGANHTLALLADGTVFAWGTGASGQCGHGTRAMARTPRMLRDQPSPSTAAPGNAGGAETNNASTPPLRVRRIFAGANSSAAIL